MVSWHFWGPSETTTTSLRFARLPEAQRFLDRDLVEGVHRHLDVGRLDPRLVGLDPDLDVVVDDPFDRHQYLHRRLFDS